VGEQRLMQQENDPKEVIGSCDGTTERIMTFGTLFLARGEKSSFAWTLIKIRMLLIKIRASSDSNDLYEDFKIQATCATFFDQKHFLKSPMTKSGQASGSLSTRALF